MTEFALVPITGEAIELAGPTADLASALSRLGDIERDLRNAKDAVKQELASRLDRDNKRRDLIDNVWEVEVDAPEQTQWDSEQLERVLTVLVQEGKLSEEAARSALEPTRVLKPRKRELDKLLKSPALTPFDRETLLQCEHPTGRPRRVTVKRK